MGLELGKDLRQIKQYADKRADMQELYSKKDNLLTQIKQLDDQIFSEQDSSTKKSLEQQRSDLNDQYQKLDNSLKKSNDRDGAILVKEQKEAIVGYNKIRTKLISFTNALDQIDNSTFVGLKNNLKTVVRLFSEELTGENTIERFVQEDVLTLKNTLLSIDTELKNYESRDSEGNLIITNEFLNSKLDGTNMSIYDFARDLADYGSKVARIESNRQRESAAVAAKIDTEQTYEKFKTELAIKEKITGVSQDGFAKALADLDGDGTVELNAATFSVSMNDWQKSKVNRKSDNDKLDTRGDDSGVNFFGERFGGYDGTQIAKGYLDLKASLGVGSETTIQKFVVDNIKATKDLVKAYLEARFLTGKNKSKSQEALQKYEEFAENPGDLTKNGGMLAVFFNAMKQTMNASPLDAMTKSLVANNKYLQLDQKVLSENKDIKASLDGMRQSKEYQEWLKTLSREQKVVATGPGFDLYMTSLLGYWQQSTGLTISVGTAIQLFNRQLENKYLDVALNVIPTLNLNGPDQKIGLFVGPSGYFEFGTDKKVSFYVAPFVGAALGQGVVAGGRVGTKIDVSNNSFGGKSGEFDVFVGGSLGAIPALNGGVAFTVDEVKSIENNAKILKEKLFPGFVESINKKFTDKTTPEEFKVMVKDYEKTSGSVNIKNRVIEGLYGLLKLAYTLGNKNLGAGLVDAISRVYAYDAKNDLKGTKFAGVEVDVVKFLTGGGVTALLGFLKFKRYGTYDERAGVESTTVTLDTKVDSKDANDVATTRTNQLISLLKDKYVAAGNGFDNFITVENGKYNIADLVPAIKNYVEIKPDGKKQFDGLSSIKVTEENQKTIITFGDPKSVSIIKPATSDKNESYDSKFEFKTDAAALSNVSENKIATLKGKDLAEYITNFENAVNGVFGSNKEKKLGGYDKSLEPEKFGIKVSKQGEILTKDELLQLINAVPNVGKMLAKDYQAKLDVILPKLNRLMLSEGASKDKKVSDLYNILTQYSTVIGGAYIEVKNTAVRIVNRRRMIDTNKSIDQRYNDRVISEGVNGLDEETKSLLVAVKNAETTNPVLNKITVNKLGNPLFAFTWGYEKGNEIIGFNEKILPYNQPYDVLMQPVEVTHEGVKNYVLGNGNFERIKDYAKNISFKDSSGTSIKLSDSQLTEINQAKLLTGNGEVDLGNNKVLKLNGRFVKTVLAKCGGNEVWGYQPEWVIEEKIPGTPATNETVTTAGEFTRDISLANNQTRNVSRGLLLGGGGQVAGGKPDKTTPGSGGEKGDNKTTPGSGGEKKPGGDSKKGR